jgi:hypothetical protein
MGTASPCPYLSVIPHPYSIVDNMAGTTPAPASVRNLYSKSPYTPQTRKLTTLAAPPQEEWLFLPPTGTNQQPNTSSGYPTNAPPTSPLGTATLAGLEIDPTSPEESLTFSDIAQLFASEFLTTAMGMPFEVGKTLLQVEYKPKEGVTAGTVDEVVVEARGDMTDDESVGDDAEGASARIRNVEASVSPSLVLLECG